MRSLQGPSRSVYAKQREWAQSTRMGTLVIAKKVQYALRLSTEDRYRVCLCEVLEEEAVAHAHLHAQVVCTREGSMLAWECIDERNMLEGV